MGCQAGPPAGMRGDIEMIAGTDGLSILALAATLAVIAFILTQRS